MAKSILVAGGAGFLGHHLCKRLIDEGHDVFVVDNLCTGFEDNVIDKSKYEVCDIQQRWSSFSTRKYDIIYNLACPASPVDYQFMPIQTTLTSVVGTNNLLELARLNNAVFVQASTSEVYGEPLHSPQHESNRSHVNPYGPRSNYDSGKMAAEALCYDYKNQYNMSVRVMRIFNCFGPRMAPNDGRVVSNFIVQSLTGRPITIYGSGMQTRSFCYVDDLIDGFVKLGFKDSWEHGPVNVGNPEERTVSSLAYSIIGMVGNGTVHHMPMPQDDPSRRCPDITLAKRELGWSPKVTLEAGLEKTIEWFRSVRNK